MNKLTSKHSDTHPVFSFAGRDDRGKYLQELADATKRYLKSGNLDMARQYMDMAETIYIYGDTHEKCLVSSVFVFSVSTFLEIHELDVASIFPAGLKKEYYMQVNASGI